MTDLAFYAEMHDMARELLNEFGSAATYRITPPKPKPNSEGVVIKPAPVDKAGLAVRTMGDQVLRLFEAPLTVVMCVKFPVNVEAEQLIIHAGKFWKTVEVKTVDPIGTGLIVAFVSCVEP